MTRPEAETETGTETKTDEAHTMAGLAAVVEQVRQYVPAMAPYFENDTTLGDYAANLQQSRIDPVHAARQELLAGTVRRVLEQALGPTAARSLVEAADIRAVNIVDHHQLLNHPLLLGTNIIANADRLIHGGRQRPIVTFSCSNVTPSNSYMRNGFQFQGEPVPYFSAKENRDAMFYTRVRRFDFTDRLKALRRWDRFGVDGQEWLSSYQDLLNSQDYAHTDRHRDQLAVALRATWPLMFDESLRANLPELLYANSEDVARECLADLLDDDNLITSALFDAGFRSTVLDAFRGVVVAWDEATGKGTHFFWRKYPGRPELLRMYIDGQDLVPTDTRFAHLRVPLESGAIRDHLEREEIIPSVALYMSVLLYAGIKPLVGPGSLVYTTQLKEGWTAVLNHHRLADEAALMSSVNVTGLIAGTPMFFERRRDLVQTLFAADVFSRGGVSVDYLKAVLATPFRDLLSVGSSGWYDLFARSYIPKEQLLTQLVDFNQAASAVHRWL